MNGIQEAQMLDDAQNANLFTGTGPRKSRTPSNFKDISGMRFGRVSVIKRHGTSKEYSATWECLCSCGSIFIAKGNLLRRGGVRSCGCLREELLRIINMTHDKSKTEQKPKDIF